MAHSEWTHSLLFLHCSQTSQLILYMLKHTRHAILSSPDVEDSFSLRFCFCSLVRFFWSGCFSMTLFLKDLIFVFARRSSSKIFSGVSVSMAVFSFCLPTFLGLVKSAFGSSLMFSEVNFLLGGSWLSFREAGVVDWTVIFCCGDDVYSKVADPFVGVGSLLSWFPDATGKFLKGIFLIIFFGFVFTVLRFSRKTIFQVFPKINGRKKNRTDGMSNA